MEELFIGWQFGASITYGLNAACAGKAEHTALPKIILQKSALSSACPAHLI